MKTSLYTTLDSLETIAAEWDALAGGEAMRSHAWLAGWWRHYSDASRGELHVVGVWDDERLVGLAPWRVEPSLRRGVTLRWLGDGEVCTDHTTILAVPGTEAGVAEAIAEHLSNEENEWQLLDLVDVDQGDPNVAALCQAMAARDAIVERLPANACWELDLPGDWEAFLQLQSKSHRKQLRRAERQLEQMDNYQWHAVADRADWEVAWPILVDLHQRRRQSLGEPGCFASQRWADFHRDISLQLLERGELKLFWAELDGKPLSAEYLVACGNTWRAYQGGLDPDRLELGPGRLSMIRFLQDAIADGVESVDFMRGDEPYKPHWRAEPQPTEHVRVVPPRLSALLRNQADSVVRQVRGAAKAGLRVFGRGAEQS